MSLTVTRAKIKSMCGITDSAYDSDIDSLIADLVPVVEYAILASYLDAPPAGLQATLDLGAAEVVAGEFLAQLSRAPGYAETIEIGDLRIEPFLDSVADPSALKAQALDRLRPYFRTDAALPRAPTSAAPGKRGDDS